LTPALHFTQFGKYEIIRKLGRSMTDVYLALDPEANRRVILKIVEQCRDPLTQLIVDAERRGAAIQQQLHTLDARILEIYEYGDQNGCFFLAMQYAEGRSLAEVIHKEGRLDADRAARYGIEICSQLQTLHSFQADIDGHSRAVVHGDIKPANIQIGPNNEVWLLDFGIAKAITATRNLTQHNLGSPAYCSPERIKNGSVDSFADLWAAGVCLYEMVSGLPPYQAQTTRKLENLIQSRRPPRALPDTCPAPLKAIIWKAMAADSARRYPSAAALEQDLRLFLDRKPASAVKEREPSWDANATLEKSRTDAPPSRQAPPVRSVTKRNLSRFLSDFNVIMWSLIAGLIIGLLCFIPASHFYRYWTDSAPLRAGRSYTRASSGEIETDWRLYRRLQQSYAWLGGYSPAIHLTESVTPRLIGAGDEVLDAYRDSTDPDIAHFDWDKALQCFTHAQEFQPAASDLKGKVALCEGYVHLTRGVAESAAALQSFQRAVALLPRSPDPHLGMARIYIYHSHNVGNASAEFHAAERLGYKLGPRESEQQADGYLYRAEQEFHSWQLAKATADQHHYETLMQRDFERARLLYEPIAGFFNVSRSLERLEADQSSVDQIRTRRERARLAALQKKSRYRRWR
jgi:serine/threonine protein kinase